MRNTLNSQRTLIASVTSKMRVPQIAHSTRGLLLRRMPISLKRTCDYSNTAQVEMRLDL